MLENCPDLLACETILSLATKNVAYLGEVDFFFSDIEKLSLLVRDAVRKSENGLRFLRTVPACLSFYLVGRGITGYRGGEFWTLVNEELGFMDNMSQYKVGAIFLKFLRDKGLYHSRIRGGLAYVSRILLHGGIPNSCLREFYDEVVQYLLERGLVEAGDIRGEIGRLREREKERGELSDTGRELGLRCESLQQEIECLQNIIRLNRRREELTGQTSDRNTGGPEYGSAASAQQNKLIISERTEKLSKRKAASQAVIRSSKSKEQTLLDLGLVVDDLAGSCEPYQYALGHIPAITREMAEHERRLRSAVSALAPLRGDDLLAGDMLWMVEREFLAGALGARESGGGLPVAPEIEALVTLATIRPEVDGLVSAAVPWCQHLLDLQAAGRERQRHDQELAAIRPLMVKWEAALDQLIGSVGLPLAGSSPKRIGELSERMTLALAREREAMRAQDELRREIGPALSGARARRTKICMQIASAGQWIRDLGGGDWDAGLKALGDKKRALVRLRDVEQGLDLFQDLGFTLALDEAPVMLERLRRELQNIGKYVDLKKEQNELLAIAAETESWADLPDYAGFMAVKQAELDGIGEEIHALREEEAACLVKVGWFTSADSSLLEYNSTIARLARDLAWYHEGQKRKEVLVAQVNECTEKMTALAAKLWPGGWDEGYAPVIRGLAMPTIEGAWTGFIKAQKACRQMEEFLTNTNVVRVRPGKEFWLGGILSLGGPVLVLAVGGIGYPATFLGLVLLATGCFRLKMARGEKTQQEQRRAALAAELLGHEAILTAGRQELARLLEGLPVSWEWIPATGGLWAELLADLQKACKERSAWEDELSQLQRGLGEWEAVLRQVATALSAPVNEAPDGAVEDLVQRADEAGRRQREASNAGVALEADILPALARAQNRRNEIEASIAAVEQRFRDLGRGDLAAGQRELAKRKLALARLTEMEVELGNIEGLSPLPGWEEAVRLEEKLMLQTGRLERYLEMKKEHQRLSGIVGDPGEWEEYADYGLFVASRESVLAELAGEIRRLEEREAQCLEIERGFTSQDQLLVAKAEDLVGLERGLALYTEWKHREEFLLRQIKAGQEEINALVNQLWSGGWDDSCLGSAGWYLAGFITQLTCYDKLEELLNTFVAGLTTLETVRGQYRCCADQLGRYQAVVADWEGKWQPIAAVLSCQTGHFPGGLPVGVSSSLGLDDEVRRLVEEKSAELTMSRISLEQMESDILERGPFLDHVDEPVQRFVLYGGDWAIKWLYACVALHRHHLRGTIDPEPVIYGLPARVFQDLDALVRSIMEEDKPKGGKTSQPERRINRKKRSLSDEKKKNTSEEFPPPELMLDHERSELKLRIGGYRFHIYDPSVPPEIRLHVVAENESLPWRQEISLRGYRQEGMVEIPEEHCPLPVFAPSYLVTLHTGGIEHRWQVRDFNDAPYLMFTEKGKRIEPDKLAQERVWLIYPDSFVVDPEKVVVSEDRLVLAGENLRLALIDFQLEPVIYLTRGREQRCEIRVSPGAVPTEPFLSAEESAPGAWTRDRRPIYVGDVPRLWVPIEDEEDIRGLRIRVAGTWADGTSEKVVTGQEIADLSVEENGRLAIFLDEERLLGPRPLGEYIVYLEHDDLGEFRFDLVIFPDLMLSFARRFYFPREEDGGRVQLNVIIPEHLEKALQVEATEPAVFMAKDGDEVHLGMDAAYNLVDLELVYSVGERSCRTPITVEVPKVRWRFQTSDGAQGQGHDDVAEIWHENCFGVDNPRLEVLLPGNWLYPVRRAKVLLDGSGQEVYAKNNKGIWEFDLAGLADSLRDGEDVCGLTLVLEDDQGREIKDGKGKLLAIRSRWRVADLRYEVRDSSEGRILKAVWTDLGKQNDRVAHLWRLEEPWGGPLAVPIADGSASLEILGSRAELPPGRYLLNFVVDDLWGGDALLTEFPRTKVNCEEIDIQAAGTQVVIEECRWKGEKSLLISGTVVNAGGSVEVALVLFGFLKGSPKDWQKTRLTDENGHFSLLMRSDWITTKSARPHWLGVMVDGKEPVYHFELLPDPGGVWWPVGSAAAQTGKNGLGGGRLFIDCRNKRLDQPFLSQEASDLFWQDMSKGNRTTKIDMRISGVSKEIDLRVTGSLHEAVMKIDAIECTACGAIVPDKDTWDREHYFSKLQCKSFNYKPIPHTVSLYWYWDTTPHVATLEEKYVLAGRRPLTLYDSLTRPIPDSVRGDQPKSGFGFDLEKLVAALWEKEVALLVAAGR